MKIEISGWVVRHHRSRDPMDRRSPAPTHPQGKGGARPSDSTASAAPRSASCDHSIDTGSAAPAAAARRTPAPDAAGSSARLLAAS